MIINYVLIPQSYLSLLQKFPTRTQNQTNINIQFCPTLNLLFKLNYNSITHQNSDICSIITIPKMTTATPSSLTLKQKKRMWKEHKADTFKEISKDKASLFNYFLHNNDIFKFISSQDEKLAHMMTVHTANKQANAFFGTLIGVFFVDQIALRFLAPNFRIPRFRFFVNLSKYVLFPCIGYTVCKQFFMEKQQQFFFSLQQKYQFNFDDYNRGNRIFERALEVNKLEELLDKRDQFDWTGIPELKQ